MNEGSTDTLTREQDIFCIFQTKSVREISHFQEIQIQVWDQYTFEEADAHLCFLTWLDRSRSIARTTALSVALSFFGGFVT